MKEGQKILDKVEDKNLIKEGYSCLTSHLSALNHYKMFEELPDKKPLSKVNMEKFIGTVAKDVQRFNAEIEASKGRIRAKSN